ncbi:2-oxoacid:acceptor oxidoreductase family protein [Desulfobacula toluolica]|uniref:PadE1: phenylglyoxylate:acceptor oxidoreductase, subunit E n=1 Tax=Desulfobacula toluolica (strain DSM 7467 / Tol2) TaxID=651182 RepID=K0NHC1_DESTT|nr:2-oxoacid:acceptor oxidoreductase family protein [Desulfobacula toluolica]CCK78402.1 PadE1: phenylglyoxylate:acceptor oxidoreductase, subunit E [Desulfobacula toluolica Tol2]
MSEVRFHGRGGQGVVTTSKILANAFARTGQFGASFPMFGFERRGAPVTAFGRFSDKPVREKTQIYNPDIIVVLDPSQRNSEAVFQGLLPGGMMLLNDPDNTVTFSNDNLKKLAIIDANKIALEEIGLAIPNTVIVGAFARMSGLLDIEPCCEALEDYFSGKKLAANIVCAKRGFDEVELFDL